jgi:FMN-dependent oxidoreductase (nitrilotriacetate monooxygenase family)
MSDTSTGRQLHLGYMYFSNGGHPTGWRYPGANRGGPVQGADLKEIGRKAEAAKFDFIFLGDRTWATAEYQWTRSFMLGRPEPFSAISYLAAATEHIGLVATASSSYYEPFNLARILASIDHLSGGRAAWNLVTGGDRESARNFGRESHGDADFRYDRADELVAVVKALWDSFADDAFVRDVDSGRFVDTALTRSIDFHGKVFDVEGPIVVGRPPQGHPVILHAGTSSRSRELGARDADIIFAATPTLEAARDLSALIRGKAKDYGRDPSKVLIMPGLNPIVGATRAEAVALYDALNALLVLDDDRRFGGRPAQFWHQPLETPRMQIGGQPLGLRNLGALSRAIGVDLTDFDLTAVVPETRAAGFNAVGQQLLAIVARRTGRAFDGDAPPLVVDLLHTFILGVDFLVGSADDIVEHIARWFNSGVVDGFNIQLAVEPQQFDAFAGLVIPRLQARGLFRKQYEGRTLREHLGLARPERSADPAHRAAVASA